MVITDGAFQNYDNNGNPIDFIAIQELEGRLRALTGDAMPNGQRAQASYLAIGSDAEPLASDERNGIFCYQAARADEIVSVMSEMADKVSGRIRIPQGSLTFVDDRTVQATSALPMLNMAALVQNSPAHVKGVKGMDTELEAVQSAKLKYPEHWGAQTDTSLLGGTFMFGNSGKTIPAGTYTFTFSESVDRDSVVIMYEPAIEARISVYTGGQEVGDIRDLLAGDVIDAVCTLYESGTDNIIDPSQLDPNVTSGFEYFEGGQAVGGGAAGGMSIKGITLNDEESELRATIQIPGFLPITRSVAFHPMPPIMYTMTADTPMGDAVLRTELCDNTKGVAFAVFGEGAPLSKADTANLNVHFAIEGPFADRLDLDVRQNDDGTYMAVPVYKKLWDIPSEAFWNWSVSWPFIGLPTGELKVVGGIGNGRFASLAEGVLTVEKEPWWSLLLNIGAPALAALWLLGLLFRRRFKWGLKARTIDVSDYGYTLMSQGPNWGQKRLAAPNAWYLIPWMPARTKIRGVTFYARPGGCIGVKVKHVGLNACRLDGSMIEDNKVVYYPASMVDDTFVPQDKEDRKHAGFEDFDSGDVLFNTTDGRNGRLFRFIGN